MTATFDPAQHPHRRRNPLTNEWVLVSPHRNQRPWQGQTEAPEPPRQARYAADCYLCPGNHRMGGAKNPDYAETFAFPNDFPALTPNTPAAPTGDGLFSLQAASGSCRVVAYSPDHSKTLAELSPTAIQGVIDCWIQESEQLGAAFEWVQIFENKGAMMGCSMPHPHGQIWAQTQAPTLVQREHEAQQDYHAAHQQALLLDYAERERDDGARTIVHNEDWIVVTPFWAAWPFETLLLPLFNASHLHATTSRQRQRLAAVLSELLIRYDNLFQCSFPYSMGWHSAPYNNQAAPYWQVHAHFYPPLLRSASIRKFMVGYEMLAEPQRDLTPEQAAAILRALPSAHYRR